MADWSKITSRGNVEDRRGASILGFGGGLGGAGLFGIIALLAVNFLMSGGQIDLNSVLNQLQTVQPSSPTQASQFQGLDSYEEFTSTVLGSTNDTWNQVFSKSGKPYKQPLLVLFRKATQSGCGIASSQVGPHYCPADETIYLDETFFDELKNRFGAKGGDVAEAYVIAHEVGHHVQNRLGIMDRYGTSRDNQDSINLELQADCFAGVWAGSLKNSGVFEPNEFDEAIDAAEAVGDDRIQEAVQGRATPETWTHGSAEQRKTWLKTGYDTGDPVACNTFK